jgi:S1-C subfamily serine protease
VATVSLLVRPPAVAALAVAAALLGGVLALVLGKATGLSDGTTDTVFISGSGTALPVERRIPEPRVKPVLGSSFDPAAIYRARRRGVVTVYSFYDGRAADEHAAQGSGFVISKRGDILTSTHVVTTAGENPTEPPASASRIFVAFDDNDRVSAKLVGWDIYDDVAVLRVDSKAHSLDPVPLGDSDRVAVGAPVAAMGSPFGNANSLAVGIVSATHRSIDSLTSRYTVSDAIQTDAPITHGNSGGPLFDARGRVIGINAQIRSDSGQTEGVGFAIPINAAKHSFEQLDRNGRVVYAYVGVNAEDLTPTIARRVGYPVKRGAVIACIVPDSPGSDAGLRGGNETRSLNGLDFRVGGDVVVKIANEPVQDADDLVRAVGRLVPGQVALFTVLREGRRMVVPVQLGQRPSKPRLKC